jgi:crossover junction endodeoxyribonuclease RuvC
MIILGIDPGVVSTGYGLLSVAAGQPAVLEYGTIVIESKLDLPSRLQGIYQRLADICGRYHPEAMAIEDLFYNKNVRTAMTVGHVRGVIILVGMHQGLTVHTYTPLQIKQAVTGYGRADKEQLQRMLKLIFKLPEAPEPDHAADALAAAFCHLNYDRVSQRSRAGERMFHDRFYPGNSEGERG